MWDRRRGWAWPALALVFALLALARPVDHDESQYVAATVLVAQGLLPYRDFTYLQTPLQPLLLAPVAWVAGAWTWPALRLVNALLGVAAVAGVHRAAREAGVGARPALVVAGLFAATDILLFSIGTARNDALPAALLAGALPLIVRAEDGRGTRAGAFAIGSLLAGAAAAKISYALPAATYGLWSLARNRRPLHVALGALGPMALVAWTYALAPEAFLFGVIEFPARAPLEWYADHPAKLSLAAKAVDALKFLALGAALPALTLVARSPRPAVLALLLAAGLIAALLPTPTWRQYLLPALPPLFTLLAVRLHRRPPGRGRRVALAVFAAAGLAPTVAAVAGQSMSLPEAMRRSAAIRRAMDEARIDGPVATLSPQFLPATGRAPLPEFATGPFYFRSSGLLDPAAERRLRLVSRARPRLAGAAAVLTGGESRKTAGSDALDAELADAARRAGWRETPVPGAPFRLFTPPGGASPKPVPRNRP